MLITGSLALAQLFLNVNQELICTLRLFRDFHSLFLWRVLALPCNYCPQLRRRIAGTESVHADEAFLLPAPEGGICRIAFNLVSGLPQLVQKIVKARWILRQYFIYELANAVPVWKWFLVAEPLVIALPFAFRVLYNGIAVLDADRVIQTVKGFGTSPKVSEFPGVVQRDGRNDDVIVDMLFT